MAIPKSNDEDILGIVLDFDDKTHSNMVRVYCPSLHSDDVRKEDLPLIPILGSGGDEGRTFSGGPAKKGTMCIVKRLNGIGHGFGYVVGVAHNDTNVKQSVAGNGDIRRHKAVAEAFAAKHKINTKARAGSGEAGSKPTEEAGEKFYQDLLKGIPNSSTLWPINGMRIPQVNSIETAIQAFSAIMPSSAIAGLAGSALSLGNLFSNMPSVIKNEIFDALPDELGTTLNSMINLIPENTPTGLSGNRINPEVFYANALRLLTECRDVDDLIRCILELLTNTDLHGADTLPNITVQIDTPFGKANVEFDINGNGTEKNSDDILNEINKFTSLLTNTSGGFPGSLVNKNMWGNSAEVMGDMMKRLKPEEFKKATQMAQNSIAPGTKPREKVNELQRLANYGQDVLSFFT